MLWPVSIRRCFATRPARSISGWRHNCSGNHLAFLAASAHAGWPLEGYRDPSHPSQVAARAAVARAAGLTAEQVPICVDGCGVVAFELPLAVLAGVYARLAAEQPRQAAAMRAHPELVRGEGRLDTELMRAVPGAVCKGGAEGLACLALPEQGLGVAVRVEDGNDRAVAPALLDVAGQLLDWPAQPVNLRDLAAPSVRNAPGDEVGMVKSDVVLATSGWQDSEDTRIGPRLTQFSAFGENPVLGSQLRGYTALRLRCTTTAEGSSVAAGSPLSECPEALGSLHHPPV